MKFTLHTKESAPEASLPVLEAGEKQFGMIPNLFGMLAESPAALHAYTSIYAALGHSDLSEIEKQVVFLAASAENGCTYCVGAHSALAAMAEMPQDSLDQLRAKQPLADAKLAALRNLTLSVLRNRGWVPDADLEACLAAGYEKRHILDVITIVAMKTLSNYVNHITGTPLDAAFADFEWSGSPD